MKLVTFVHEKAAPQIGVLTRNEQAIVLLQRATELMNMVDLRPEHLFRYPHEFSGGQQQRICIARALATQPEFLVFDEATSALDVSVQAQILNLMADLQKRLNLTFLFISHDLSIMEHICHRVAVMYAGRVMEIQDADALFASPRHPYTKALRDAVPIADPTQTDGMTILEGTIEQLSDLGPLVRVAAACDAGFQLSVSLGKKEYDHGAWKRGDRVHLAVAAEDVHILED